jgi:hypothetical protein
MLRAGVCADLRAASWPAALLSPTALRVAGTTPASTVRSPLQSTLAPPIQSTNHPGDSTTAPPTTPSHENGKADIARVKHSL